MELPSNKPSVEPVRKLLAILRQVPGAIYLSSVLNLLLTDRSNAEKLAFLAKRVFDGLVLAVSTKDGDAALAYQCIYENLIDFEHVLRDWVLVLVERLEIDSSDPSTIEILRCCACMYDPVTILIKRHCDQDLIPAWRRERHDSLSYQHDDFTSTLLGSNIAPSQIQLINRFLNSIQTGKSQKKWQITASQVGQDITMCELTDTSTASLEERDRNSNLSVASTTNKRRIS
ncbi:hypothetical protein NEOLI_000527 [Neolecta irregularis DAH-3]|uniref:Uncharacterized protein n=1 Tax=Neolecta irregularis (strain DAH-3) TaxID=1198029 RepID=A0A1U7LSD5_NEOID|nr:hypothetical protein NEOLI_000527 [Neolecta irregularis DAH-3]|eukprot:OLL25431.1 hypothetical protein NEOLI_000527 [Neolecta irregularis DAH-3]